MVREQWLDSRKDVDRQLKSSCEAFIADATNSITGSLTTFIDKVSGLYTFIFNNSIVRTETEVKDISVTKK